MTLAQLALTVALIGVLGLVVSRFGLSAIPAYLLAGLLLGPHEPKDLSLIRPSEVTDFLAELGIVFLLFFLGLEFTFGRLLRTGRHLGLGGLVDLAANAGLGLVVGVSAFGFSFAALILAGAVYVSSSAVTVKGLIDFRRLADEETDLVLAILLVEDIAFVVGMSALAKELGLSEAIGALMAGVTLADTTARAEIEERFFSFRDLFGALFFFVFGLSIDVGTLGRVGWYLALAVCLTLIGKIGGGYLAGLVGGFTRRQSLNAGIALVAHGEFTIILAQLASHNDAIPAIDRDTLVAFAGL